MAKSINFNTGLKTYVINGDENNVIKVNFADPNLYDRVSKVSEKITEIMDGAAEFNVEYANEADRKIKALIDETFNADISSHVFGNASVFSYVDGEKTILLESFISAFLPFMEKEITESLSESKNSRSERLNEYIESINEINNSVSDDEKDEYAEFLAWKASKKVD